MKRTVLFIVIFVCGLLSVQATKQSKAGILSTFMKEWGVKTIALWAHPLCTLNADKTIITTNPNSVIITLFYSNGSKDFSCRYNLQINSNGNFSSFMVQQDGSPKDRCFAACNKNKDWQKNLKMYKEDKTIVSTLEQVLHRNYSTFDCQDYALMGLTYYWMKEGYKEKYLSKE